MSFDFGDIVLVPFPFTSQTASKKRPAVVVSSHVYNRVKPDIVVMAVTSQLRATAALGEIWLQDWQVAGLLKPSAIKPVFATLEQALVLRQLGRLDRLDERALRVEISKPCRRLNNARANRNCIMRALMMPGVARRSAREIGYQADG